MIAVLVPVLARPRNVQPFLDSLAVTEEKYNVYFICSLGDMSEIKECKRSDASVLIHPEQAGKANFAKKINWALPQTTEEWIFQAADDITFGKNWDKHALAVAARTRALVIGTNDLGNPQVRRGTHSTHTLFKRSYIDEYGSGTVDGSGLVFSEKYDHQWCDNEFTQTAIFRKQWAFSRHSVVEHLHPHWGKTKMDSTYKKAMRATSSDLALFKSRLLLMKQKTHQERRMRRGAVIDSQS